MEYKLGSRLSELRKRRGLSLSQLARLAGISKSTLWEIENDRISPSVNTLWAIANALGVPFGELVTYDIVVKDEGVEVRLIERVENKEVYLMKLRSHVIKRSEPHRNSPIEIVQVIKGAMIVGSRDNLSLVGEGDFAKFYGGREHLYMAVGGDAEAVVTLIYGSKDESPTIHYKNIRKVNIPRYRDLIDENVENNFLKILINAVNRLRTIEGLEGSLTADVLNAEILTLGGKLTIPKAVREGARKLSQNARSSERLYELLRPGYAEQVIYVAYELERRGIRDVLSLGCGPAYRERMLKEILNLGITCVEAPKKATSTFPTLDELPEEAGAVVSFGSSHYIDVLELTSRLSRGGVLIVADEFIDHFASEKARKLNVVKHHLVYLLDIPLEAFREELLSAYNAAAEGKLRTALNILSRVYVDISEGIKGEGGTDEEKAFSNFYRLELTSLLLGVIEERKTSVVKFVSEAAGRGLRLESHYKVYSTGEGKFGGGAHVLAFRRV
ncbi:XRE family transcriptional regulator [Thermoproteus tenax]|uniref:Transcriptional regulator, xre family n=1 Tax=Thermoproteus tenax (strain ATCC 35583 / DSM 2078 / JCM 9277 / NBRC 100435 / Kra 1) TaxID=768679 RepID=G4RLG9_THETK|nr:XRE family transcriptional regulator [Thermoproteus tenax]CCC82414.1 transcriptional regulator, xre family [Thermoproteus tenax Kra 1]